MPHLLVACGDAAKMLDLVEEALDQIAVLVDVLVVGDGLRSRSGRWNDGRRPGIAQAESEGLVPLLRRVRHETGCAMLVIEHDMPLISAISDELLALDEGQVGAGARHGGDAGPDKVRPT